MLLGWGMDAGDYERLGNVQLNYKVTSRLHGCHILGEHHSYPGRWHLISIIPGCDWLGRGHDNLG